MPWVSQSIDQSSRMKRNNSALVISYFIVNFFLLVFFVAFFNAQIVIFSILASALQTRVLGKWMGWPFQRPWLEFHICSWLRDSLVMWWDKFSSTASFTKSHVVIFSILASTLWAFVLWRCTWLPLQRSGMKFHVWTWFWHRLIKRRIRLTNAISDNLFCSSCFIDRGGSS